MREISLAIITLLGVIVSTVGGIIVKYLIDKRRRDWDDQKGFLDDISRLNIIHREIDDLMTNTKADRFLILRAENGVTDPKHATAVYVQHRLHPVPTYFRIKIDDEYRKMLRDAENDGVVKLAVADMKNCLLKNIYVSEGVQHSNCYFIARKNMPDGKSVLTYCTLATHSEKPFKNEDEMKQLVFVSKLRALVFHPESQVDETNQLS